MTGSFPTIDCIAYCILTKVLVFRRPERLECSSNTEMDIQQIPSEAALYRAGCVEKLTQILDTNLVYVLAALAAVAFMGNTNHYTVLHF